MVVAVAVALAVAVAAPLLLLLCLLLLLPHCIAFLLQGRLPDPPDLQVGRSIGGLLSREAPDRPGTVPAHVLVLRVEDADGLCQPGQVGAAQRRLRQRSK